MEGSYLGKISLYKPLTDSERYEDAFKVYTMDKEFVTIPANLVEKIPYFVELKKNANGITPFARIARADTLESLLIYVEGHREEDLFSCEDLYPLHWEESSFPRRDTTKTRHEINTAFDRYFCMIHSAKDLAQILNLANALQMDRLVAMLCRHFSSHFTKLSNADRIRGYLSIGNDIHEEKKEKLEKRENSFKRHDDTLMMMGFSILGDTYHRYKQIDVTESMETIDPEDVPVEF